MPKIQAPVSTVLLVVLLLLAGCASQSPQTVLYSLDGPPLAIAGEQGETVFTGQMERSCLTAQGEISFESSEMSCSGTLKGRFNQAGHIQAIIPCDNGEVLALSFRSLGPDQGLGLGRFFNQAATSRGKALIFYFHPWDEEAKRRLEQEKITLRDIIAKKKKP